jgi:hypothetical protein
LGIKDKDWEHVAEKTKDDLYATCDLECASALSSTKRRTIFDLALSKMKPLRDLTDVSTIFNAMEDPCPFYSALGEIQEEACTNNNTKLAVLILASFGVFSEGLKRHIECRRHLLTEGIMCHWRTGKPTKSELTELVEQYSSTTTIQHLNGFDFQRGTALKETPQS